MVFQPHEIVSENITRLGVGEKETLGTDHRLADLVGLGLVLYEIRISTRTRQAFESRPEDHGHCGSLLTIVFRSSSIPFECWAVD